VNPSLLAAQLETITRLGVPTFVLVFLLLVAVPRADRAIDQLALIDTRLQVLTASCSALPLQNRSTEPLGPR